MIDDIPWDEHPWAIGAAKDAGDSVCMYAKKPRHNIEWHPRWSQYEIGVRWARVDGYIGGDWRDSWRERP